MSILSKTEIGKLSIMYEGDKARDASSKIRGFLFQDYITIMCLLKNEAEYVCTEYLEDINVFYKDGTFEVIQVKYYPKTSPDMKEITTDLYYQYLRAQMLQSKLKAVPRLYIHRKARTTAIENLTVEKMKENIGLGSMLPKSRDYPKLEEVNEWLRQNVYTESKKEAQKKKLFSTMASEISLKSFVEKFDVSHQEDINQYKEVLMEKLAAVYPNPVKNGEEEHWRVILLGLAITYVQQRYVLENPEFDQLRMSKEEFDQYMKESAETEKEQTIASYLVGVACGKYGEIINYNDLSDLQLHMLNLIYQNTLRWLSEIGQSVEGQYQLVNTLSCREFSQISDYKEKSIKERFKSIVECHYAFLKFLGYLWKIMLDICQKKVHDEAQISKCLEIFNPRYYMDSSVVGYVCLNFPEDRYVNKCVILPPASGEFRSMKRKIIARMVEISPRPEKWFYQNNDLTKGKNYYDYSTADVSDNPTVADLGEESFYIECMKCIGIDDDEWNRQEDCQNCIFSVKCIEEEK